MLEVIKNNVDEMLFVELASVETMYLNKYICFIWYKVHVGILFSNNQNKFNYGNLSFFMQYFVAAFCGDIFSNLIGVWVARQVPVNIAYFYVHM